MQKFLLFAVLVLGLFFGPARLVSAQQCKGPVYCVGPCGTLSHTCSCIKQSCYTVTPVNAPTCTWGSGSNILYTTYIPPYGCESGLYCTTYDDSFPCADQGSYVDPCYTGDCQGGGGGGGGGGATPTPTPAPGVGWCTVGASAGTLTTGQAVTVSLQASSQNAAGNTAYLKVSRRDHGAIAGLPVEANNEYTVASCSSTTDICSTGTTRTLPTGEYYFYCGYEAGAPSCSGRPFCDYEGIVGVSTESCPGLSSCNNAGGNDNAHLDVVAPLVTVTANVYDDPQANCTGTTNPPAADYAGATIALLRTSPPGSSIGSFSSVKTAAVFSGVEGGSVNYSLSFTNNDPNWVSACSSGTNDFTVDASDIVKNYYVTRAAEPWWKAVGGDGYGRNFS